MSFITLTHTVSFLANFLIVCIFLVIFLSKQEKSVSASFSSTQISSVEQSIVDNIAQNGYNSQTNGLYINWRYGTSPLQTNLNGTGMPDGSGVNPPRHDPLTDIRYLHNLWLYKSQNPTDTRYDSQVQKYTVIIKSEFASSHDTQRGWLYDEEFSDLYALSHDNFYQQQMQNLATAYASSINKTAGIFFKTNSAHPGGYYRPEDALETGLGLIMAGTQFNNSSWVQLGKTEIDFVYAHAYLSAYHTFADQMDQVLSTSGTINPNETFYTDTYRNYIVHGNYMVIGSIAQISIALLHTYQITHDTTYLTKAQDLLDAVSSPANPLGMWDKTNLGYFESVVFAGQTAQSPGTISVNTGKKEAGRQMIMLWAYHLANQYLNNRYQNMEQAMITIGLTKAYYPPGHGVIYEMRPDWSLVTINGIPEDWVTTEAMGAELEALFSVGSAVLPSGGPTSPPVSITLTPSQIPSAFFLAACPHGLGNCGDNVSPSSGGNANPLHTSRAITLTLFDLHNTQVGQPLIGQVTYTSSAQNFQGYIPFTGIASGQYLVLLKMDGFLSKLIPGIISIIAGQTVSLPEVSFVTGDINNDNQLDIQDYNLLISCFGSKYTTSNCPAPNSSVSPGADINDDGVVDGVDYNMLLRELSVQRGV